jgi:hypothetical protein
MMDMIKALQDPVLMEKLTNAPTEILAKLTAIENGIAEILQICKSAKPLQHTHSEVVDIVAAIVGSVLTTREVEEIATALVGEGSPATMPATETA